MSPPFLIGGERAGLGSEITGVRSYGEQEYLERERIMVRAGMLLMTAALIKGLIFLVPVAAEERGEGTGRVARAKVRKGLTLSDYRMAEKRLSDLGYWVGKIDGRWDEAARHGLTAFQKVEGLRRTGTLSAGDLDRLLVAERPRALLSGLFHLEVDLARQVLFVVDGNGNVEKVLPISSGNGRRFVSQGWAREAITHPGWYSVDRKVRGWNRSPLGLLYYPIYFMWGTAIHGAPSVPTRPDSHGCVRIPVGSARSLFDSVPAGTPVIVHRGALPPRPPAVLMPVVDAMVEIDHR